MPIKKEDVTDNNTIVHLLIIHNLGISFFPSRAYDFLMSLYRQATRGSELTHKQRKSLLSTMNRYSRLIPDHILFSVTSECQQYNDKPEILWEIITSRSKRSNKAP
jgi:hypothetical protein